MELQLNRDYINNPLKRGEYPEIDDVKFLFLTLNLSREECAAVCHCNPEKIKIMCQANKFSKTKEQRSEVRKRTLQKKYGVSNISQCNHIKDKKKQTSLDHYGVENPSQFSGIKEKIKQNCLNKYGVDSTNSLQWKKEKVRKTNLEKYNVPNIMQVLTTEKLNKHAQRIKDKIINNKPHMVNQIYNTKKANNSFNISQSEIYIREMLEKVVEVRTQYKSKEYPFACDFYISSLNLYIEYNGTWTHGGMPYVHNEQCNSKLQIWKEKAKTSKFYQNAIKTWTIRDVIKRETARRNKLNWLEFFTLKDFYDWYCTKYNITGEE